MKRTVIAVVLLLLIVVGGSVACYTLKQASEEITAGLQAVERAYRGEQKAVCRRETETLQRVFDKYASVFPFLLNHETVHGLEESITQLRTLLETGDDTMFLSEIIHCQALVEEMYRKELPLPENIF